jgi:hypothetical protein
MILNGKAKEDFIKTKIGNEISLFESMLPIYSNALIIEWFDSVGICIDRDCINMEMVITDFKGIKEKQTIIDCGLEEPFPDWWKKAIKKANEIYNEKYSISQ